MPSFSDGDGGRQVSNNNQTMTVYVLLCYYDSDTQLCGVFTTKAKALAEAKRMEQNDEVEIDNWSIEKQKVK